MSETKSLADLRREYTLGGLRRADLGTDPILQFKQWFDQARGAGLVEPNAMTPATVGKDAPPSPITGPNWSARFALREPSAKLGASSRMNISTHVPRAAAWRRGPRARA